MMRQVQETEAPARLSELLRTVERGETIVITRHGKAVAQLAPAEDQERAPREAAAHRSPTEDQERTRRKAAMARFLARRRRWRRIDMSTAEILAARHEGHRF